MSFIGLMIGLMIGGVSSFLIARHYYERDIELLTTDLSKYIELNMRLLQHLEKAGLVHLNRDSRGNIIGLEVKPKPESERSHGVGDNKTLH
jgi:hypothetical protein